MAFKELLRVARKFENLHALIHVGLVRGLQPVNLALAAVLLLAPLARHLFVKRRFNNAVELIDVHGTDAVIKTLVFGLMALDRFLVLSPLVGMAGVQRVAHPFQHLVVEVQPAQEFGELLLKHLLAHILAPAGRRVALAFVGVAGAVVVDVAFLLDLADHRAAAGMTGDQAGEREVACHAALLLSQPAVHHGLHPLPEFD